MKIYNPFLILYFDYEEIRIMLKLTELDFEQFYLIHNITQIDIEDAHSLFQLNKENKKIILFNDDLDYEIRIYPIFCFIYSLKKKRFRFFN